MALVEKDKSVTSVLVSNISPLLEKHHLTELFGCCGEIKSAELTKNAMGERICKIEFAMPEHAIAAQFLSGTPLGDRALQVVTLNGDSSGSLASSAAQPVAEMKDGDPTPVTPLMPNFQLGTNVSLPQPLVVAAQKRAEEVARTVYVGNLNGVINEEHLRQFFKSCGDIIYIKLAGDAAQSARYAFIEFKELPSAQTALTLSGTMLGDRAIKVGKANNPIVKVGGASGEPTVQDPEKLEEAMERVRKLQKKISKKVEVEEKDGDPKDVKDTKDKDKKRSSRSRSKGRRSRSGSRHKKRSSRSRGDRRRSRSRDNRRKSKRSRSRSWPRAVSSHYKPKAKKPQADYSGMFWDGFQWNPKPETLLKKAQDSQSQILGFFNK